MAYLYYILIIYLNVKKFILVCGAWKEPTPGWVDNMFAFTGLLVGMGKGFLRSLYIKTGIKLDFIPVDIAINLMIAAAWNTDVKEYT